MIEQLEQVCLAVGSVRESDVERVVESVNGKIAKLLNAHIVKLYWRQEAEGGGVILRPVSFINDSDGPDPQHFPITPERPGVLEWVFRTGRPLWLEQIRRHYDEETIVNRCDGRPLATSDMAFTQPPQSDAMVVIPLVERGIVHGLYAAELASTRGLSERVVALMQRLGRPLGTLLYNSDVFAYDLRKSNRAINRMLASMQAFNFDRVMLDQDCRTAFIARPYEDQYLRIQRALERLLEARGIRAKHYEAENRQYVVNEIIGQIRNAHFCVADLTGNNLNVVAEVGMMMVLGKKPLVVRRRGDASQIPFDLSQFSFWEYELGGDDELLVQSPAAGELVPFDTVLDRFLDDLPAETGFFMAKEWRPAETPAGGDAPAVAAGAPG